LDLQQKTGVLTHQIMFFCKKFFYYFWSNKGILQVFASEYCSPVFMQKMNELIFCKVLKKQSRFLQGFSKTYKNRL
jgi:hypothetical protein